MKFKYNKEDDILSILFNKKDIYTAEQEGDVIVHFSSKNEMVLIEILDASRFLKQVFRSIPRKVMQSMFFPASTPSIAFKK